jgi:hypothetical protein
MDDKNLPIQHIQHQKSQPKLGRIRTKVLTSNSTTDGEDSGTTRSVLTLYICFSLSIPDLDERLPTVLGISGDVYAKK